MMTQYKDWTVIKSKHQLRRWEKNNQITYTISQQDFPCLVRDDICADENCQTQVLTRADLITMLGALG